MPQVLFASATPILAVDVANLAYRAHFGYRNLTAGGRHNGHVYGFLQMLLTYVRRHRVDEVWFAREGYSRRRRKLLPEYKANRTSSEGPGDFLTEINELVGLLPGQVWYHPGMEGDDLLGMMTTARGDRPLVIVSGDHDLYQFVGRPGIVVWNKDHLVDDIEVRASFDVGPQSVALHKTLFGDVRDNVPAAVPRLRRAPVLEYIEQHGIRTVDEFRARFDGLPQVLRDRINDYWPQIERNWKLVRLRTKVHEGVQRTAGPDSPRRLLRFLSKWGCRSLYDKLKDLWSIPS